MSLVDDIKNAIDLVELAEESTQLRKTGHAFTGFCPFHANSRTPALVVWPESQTWKCFGCNKGGSAFDWVMERDSLDFRGALESLSKMAGIPLERSPEAIKAYQKQRTLYDALTFAANFYHGQLWQPDAAAALDKRGRRGLPEQVLLSLKWGYSRADDGLMRAMMDQQPDMIPVAREYGLIRRDGRDFTANSDGDKISPEGWIIYPHFERGNLAGQVCYLSSRAVADIDHGSKSRNLPGVVDIQPYLLLTGAPTAANGDDAGVNISRLADDIIITEGPPDAATVWAMGYPAAALMKQSFNPKFDWLKTHLQRKLSRGSKVYIGLSNDEPGRLGALGKWENGERQPGVCEAINPLVEVLYWPRPDGADKSDANSWLQSGAGPEDMPALLTTGQTFLQAMINEAAGLTRQTRQIKHLAGLVAQLNEDDRADFTNLICEARGIKVTRAEFQRYLREAMQSRNGNAQAVEIVNGMFTDCGEPLASCLARITHQQLIHAKNEDEVTIRYRIEGKHPTGKPLKAIEIKSSEFEDFKWMAQHWGVDGFVMVGRNKLNKLKNAVINYSIKEIQREEIYSYTGWEIINDQRGYLTASGFLTAAGLDTTIKVELAGNLESYRLPNPPDEIMLIDAIEASLSSLDIGPDSITVPLLLSQYASPLRPLQSFNALMVLYGPSQAKKSNTSHVFLCHFGDFLSGLSKRDYKTVIDAASTSIMIQQYNNRLADSVLVVDDVPPGSSNFEITQQRKKIETLAREMGNRAGRERWGYTSMPPNTGICMITAEKLAMQVGSAVGRSFTVEYEADSIDLERLTKAQLEDHAYYSQAMAGYVQWLARNWEDLETGLPKQVRAFQKEVEGRYTKPRLHDYYATMMVAGAVLLQWAKEANAIDAALEAAYLQRFRDGLIANLDRQEERIAEMQFSRRFFEALAALLVRPHCLMPMNGRYYTDDLGQPRVTFEPPQGTPLLGWRDTDRGLIYLHDVEALKHVRHHLADLGEFMDVSLVDLRKEMYYLEILARVERTARGERDIIQFCPKVTLPERGKQRVLIINPLKVKELYDVDLLDSADPTTDDRGANRD